MKIIDVEQGTPEWFEARLGKATASMFDAIMSTTKNGYSTAGRANYKAQLVVERLTGKISEGYQSKPMEWGIETEPLARVAYQLKTGVDAGKCGFVVHDELEVGASPDGLIGTKGTLEIKCPNTATHIETLHLGDLNPKYKWQVQGQLWVTNREWCDFVSYDPRLPANAEMFVIRVKRDEEAIERLKTEVPKFLEEVEEEVEFLRAYK